MPFLQSKSNLDHFDRFFNAELHLLKERVGLIVDSEIHVLLVPVNENGIPENWSDHKNPSITIFINYHGCQVTVAVTPQVHDEPLALFANRTQHLTCKSGRPLTAVIKGLIPFSEESIEDDTNSLLTSVLFDIEFKYGLALETVKYEVLHRPGLYRKRAFQELPITPIGLIYKPYLSQLLNYFHAAEKTQSFHFKCICYFNILDYFFSRGSNQFISQVMRMLKINPDFQHRTDFYINKTIKIFKQGNDSGISDTARIRQVLLEFISPAEIQSLLDRQMLIEHFTSEHLFKCGRPVVLPALEFSDEKLFYRSLAERIYYLMSSICGMYAESEWNTSIPFMSNSENLGLLAKETGLLKEIAMMMTHRSISLKKQSSLRTAEGRMLNEKINLALSIECLNLTE